MQTEMGRTALMSSNKFFVIDNGAANQAWRMDFARIYAARERCTPVQGGRAASVLCESLGLLSPMVAVAIVLADDDLVAALRIATREVPGDSQSARVRST